MPKVICEGCSFFNGMGFLIEESPYENNEFGFCQNQDVRTEQLQRRGAVTRMMGSLDARGEPMKRYSKTPRYCNFRKEES